MITKLRAVSAEESGFTLVELLIVISILGILAGIVVFSVAGITDDGTVAACKTEKAILSAAQEAYYAKDAAPKNYAANVAALQGAGLLGADAPTYATTTGTAAPGSTYTVSGGTTC